MNPGKSPSVVIPVGAIPQASASAASGIERTAAFSAAITKLEQSSRGDHQRMFGNYEICIKALRDKIALTGRPRPMEPFQFDVFQRCEGAPFPKKCRGTATFDHEGKLDTISTVIFTNPDQKVLNLPGPLEQQADPRPVRALVNPHQSFHNYSHLLPAPPQKTQKTIGKRAYLLYAIAKTESSLNPFAIGRNKTRRK